MIAIMSDSVDHSKAAVCCFLDSIFNDLISENSKNLQINLWSDGPASQFKNRFMAAFLLHRSTNFKVITWNFFATSHGKGAIDGVGGSLKRSAWNKVKSRQAEIRNAEELAHVLQQSSTVDITYISEEAIVSHWDNIKSFVENARNVSMILFCPLSKHLIESPNLFRFLEFHGPTAGLPSMAETSSIDSSHQQSYLFKPSEALRM